MSARVKIIAEIGSNHMGDFNFAIKMLDSLAAFPDEYKIDVVKFQKRCPRVILSEEVYNSPHPNLKNAFGETYGLHKEFLEFSVAQHEFFKDYCEKNGFCYSVSVFDMVSAREMVSLKPNMIKLSSANNIDYDLIKYLNDNYDGELHVSLGMTTRNEEEKIVETIRNKKNTVLYACVSAYPTPDDKLSLLEIKRLKNAYGSTVKAIGFSGHHWGIIQDVAAVALGAEYIERHYTLDRTLKGTDQCFSLEPHDMLQLSKNIRTVSEGLTLKEKEILDVEESVKQRLKYRAMAEVG